MSNLEENGEGVQTSEEPGPWPRGPEAPLGLPCTEGRRWKNEVPRRTPDSPGETKR